MFILIDFKKRCFDVSSKTLISVSTVILRLGKVEFIKKLTSEKVCLLGWLAL